MGMVQFTAVINKFDKMGEKTGWTYIDIPEAIAQKIFPGNKKSFRAKGKLDSYSFKGAYLIPMGGGNFILPVNAEMRKGTGKKKGAMLKVQITVDKEEYQFNKEFMELLADEPEALAFFRSLTPAHQRYWSKNIDNAKTEETKARRIAESLIALNKKFDYSQMLRSVRQKRKDMEG